MSRYCSYALQMCPTNTVQECAKHNPVECRNCRQKNEAAQQEGTADDKP